MTKSFSARFARWVPDRQRFPLPTSSTSSCASGFHPGTKRYVPAPPPPPDGFRRRTCTTTGQSCAGVRRSWRSAADHRHQRRSAVRSAVARSNRGQSISLTANVQDADGDTLTFRWTAPSGYLLDAEWTQHALHRGQSGRQCADHRHGRRRQGRHRDADQFNVNSHAAARPHRSCS